MTFYADFSEADAAPEKRTLTFHPDTGNITTSIYEPLVAEPDSSDDFDLAATHLRLENAALDTGPDGPDPGTQPDQLPFLRYYAYQTVGNPPHPEPTMPLVPDADGLSTAEAARVARIEIAFVSRPTGATTNDKGVHLSDQIVARHADPNLTVPDPKCV